MSHKQSKPVILKTSMREAFEAIQISKAKSETLLKTVLKSLQKNSGIIYRRKMWAVLRHGKTIDPIKMGKRLLNMGFTLKRNEQ